MCSYPGILYAWNEIARGFRRDGIWWKIWQWQGNIKYYCPCTWLSRNHQIPRNIYRIIIIRYNNKYIATCIYFFWLTYNFWNIKKNSLNEGSDHGRKNYKIRLKELKWYISSWFSYPMSVLQTLTDRRKTLFIWGYERKESHK